MYPCVPIFKTKEFDATLRFEKMQLIHLLESSGFLMIDWPKM